MPSDLDPVVEAMANGSKRKSLDPSDFVTMGERHHWCDLMHAALAAADAAGFVLVPKEATEEMIGAAWQYDPLNCDVDSSETRAVYTAIYSAMLAAAPKP